IVLCLTDTPAVHQVLGELAPHLPAAGLVIDTTTNDTEGPKAFADLLVNIGSNTGHDVGVKTRQSRMI
ncbi:MAG: hypothetical protein ACPHIV_04880, partial [Candidatus Puniceispirillaceae bacterium]